jgi:hypothetical protein
MRNGIVTALVVTFATALVAGCAADTSSVAVEEADVTTGKDVSASYVGDYGTPASGVAGAIKDLRLATTRAYELTTASGLETGTYKVLSNASGTTLVLTLAKGGTRSYKVTLGSGARPLLTVRRSSTAQTLERAPVSCDAVNCGAGFACAVVTDRGVPGPVCNAVTPTWKTAFAGHPTWGASLPAMLPTGSGTDKPLYCTVRPATATISCNTSWEGDSGAYQISATISPDGTFSSAFDGTQGGVPGSAGEVDGVVKADGTVVVNHYRGKTCYQTSSYWCDGYTSDRAGQAAAVAICRTPDQHFESGGWASGYWLACSQCPSVQGGCLPEN